MRSLRTVILRHDRPGDSHLDWLIEHPAHPPATGPLLCFRLSAAFGGGLAAPISSPRKILLHQLPDHRRLYLTYQGPHSGGGGRGRGRVRLIDSGRVLLLRFSVDRIDLQLFLRRTSCRLALRRIAINAWSAALIPVS